MAFGATGWGSGKSCRMFGIGRVAILTIVRKFAAAHAMTGAADAGFQIACPSAAVSLSPRNPLWSFPPSRHLITATAYQCSRARPSGFGRRCAPNHRMKLRAPPPRSKSRPFAGNVTMPYREPISRRTFPRREAVRKFRSGPQITTGRAFIRLHPARERHFNPIHATQTPPAHDLQPGRDRPVVPSVTGERNGRKAPRDQA